MKITRKLTRILVIGAAVAVLSSVLMPADRAAAINPATINFQGKVVKADGTNVTDGTYPFTFKLYSVASGGTAIWGETQASVTVVSGVFQVNLGGTCSLFLTQTCGTFSNTAIDFNANPALYLGITFNGDAAGEMTPRPQLQSVPFAFNADKVGGLTASQFVQLSPTGAQTGYLNVSGGNSLLNNSGTGNTTIGGSSGTLTLGGAAAGAVSLQSAAAINLTAAANSTLNFGASTLGITSSTLTVAPATGVVTIGGTTPTLTTSGAALSLGVGTLGTLSLTPNTATIQRTAAGTTTLDLNDAGTTLLNLKNSGAGVANLNLFGGSLQTGSTPVTRLDNAGNLTNIGTYSASVAATNGQSLASIGNSTTGANLFNVQNIAPNFGAAAAAGAFVDKNSYFSEEYNVFHAANGTAALAYLRGDSGANTTSTTAAAGQGELTLGAVIGGGGASIAVSTLGSTPGGIEQLNANSTNAGNAIIEEYLAGGAIGTAQKNWLAANLPLFTTKAKLATTGSNTVRYFMGLSDMQVTAAGAPTNGMYFTNCSVAAGTTCDTTLRGVTENAGVATFVTCGTIVPGSFAYMRIDVRSTTDVHFYADLDASNGINEIECGTGSTTNIPTVALTNMSKVDNTTAGASTATLQIDYQRIWQDDAATPALVSDNITPSESTKTPGSGSLTPITATDPLADQGPTPTAMTLGLTNQISAITSDSSGQSESTVRTDKGYQLRDANGKIVVDFATDGSATFAGALNIASASTSGGLSVGGDLTVSGLSVFEKLATFIGKTIFRQDVQFDGHITVAGDSAGYVLMHKSEDTVHVTFKSAYENAPIVSTSTVDGQFVPVVVSSISKTGFTVSVATPLTQDTKFAWTAVGVNDPQTATNPLASSAP